MNTKDIRNKTVMAGTVAAGLILGVAALASQSDAFAAADASASASAVSTASAQSAQAPDERFGRGGHRVTGGFKGELARQAAEAIGIDESALREQLSAGSTLVEVAVANGVTKESLVAKLTDAAKAELDALVAAGTLTQAQADERIAELTERLPDMVETSGFGKGGRGGHGRGFGFGAFGSLEAAANALGIAADEIKAGLEAGQSLAEIAAAKGVAEDELVEALKDAMTDRLKTFVNEKRTPPAAYGDTSEATNP